MKHKRRIRITSWLLTVVLSLSMVSPVAASALTAAESTSGSLSALVESISQAESESASESISAPAESTSSAESESASESVSAPAESTSSAESESASESVSAPAESTSSAESESASESVSAPAESNSQAGSESASESVSAPAESTSSTESESTSESISAPVESNSLAESESASEESEEEQLPDLEITEMFTHREAVPGDVIEMFVKTNREDVSYQWQILDTTPEREEMPEAIYPYGEGESTDYAFLIDGMTEEELLAVNPDAVWPGIEMYYAEKEKRAQLRSNEPIRIENGTPNYVLNPEEKEIEDSEAAWRDIDGETNSTYLHTVTEEENGKFYRCVVTLNESAQKEVLAKARQAEEETQSVISDSMYAEIPEQEPKAELFSISGDVQQVALSADKQWLTGLTPHMEYITKDTYDRMGAEAAGNAYWTKISGGARPDGTKYAPTSLVDDSQMEVLSAWYGKTVYVRMQGTSGTGKAIEIPAYTGTDYQTGKKTLYKSAVKIINAYVPDTGMSFYNAFLRTALNNGWTSNGCHISLDAIPIDNFNRVPNNYLTNAEGDYIYDLVIIGASASSEPDLSGAAAWALSDYIGQGYGFMIGHDMMYGYGGVNPNPDYVPSKTDTTTPYYVANTKENGHWNMNWLMGVNKLYTQASPYEAASMILNIGDFSDKSTLYGDDSGISVLQVRKRVDGDPSTDVSIRCPTNWPFKKTHDGYDFTVGHQFKGTATHTNQQMAFGTVWIDYASNSITEKGCGKLVEKAVDGVLGTNNFYLTTNGNFGMSQIGHKTENVNLAKLDECYILANTVMYLSQRQQCQVCQSQQGGNQEIHFVHRISTAEELQKLNDQDKYWFTYPMDGCYMLTRDIALQGNWTPIQGFYGHFNADNHKVSGSNAPVFEQKGTLGEHDKTGRGGWNLGTDKTQGNPRITAENGSRVTGTARVVGYLSGLFETKDVDWAGAKVVIYGSDGKEYSCIANDDGKYVISNVPTTGVQKAEVWHQGKAQSEIYGAIRVNVPSSFWNTNETTPLYLLGFSAMPVKNAQTYETRSASMVEGGVFWNKKVTDIQWQVRQGNSGAWQNIESVEALKGHYRVNAPEFTKLDGEACTLTTLSLDNVWSDWDGWYFRAVFRADGNTADTFSVKTDGKEGKLTVRRFPLKITQAFDAEVYVGEDVSFSSSAQYLAGKDQGLKVEWEFKKHAGTDEWYPVMGSGEFTLEVKTTSSAVDIPVYQKMEDELALDHRKGYETKTELKIKSCDLDYNGYSFRAHYSYTSPSGKTYHWYSNASDNTAYRWDMDVKAYGENQAGAAAPGRAGYLKVKPAEIQAYLRKAADEDVSKGQIDNLTPDEYGQKVMLKRGETYSDDTAAYTAIIYYRPEDALNVRVRWDYSTLLNTTPKEWNQSAAQKIDPKIKTAIKNQDLGVIEKGHDYYQAEYEGWRAMKSVLTINNIPSSMYDTQTMTKYFFRCYATGTYDTSKGEQTVYGKTGYGGLVQDYDIYLYHKGVNTYQGQNVINGTLVTTVGGIEKATDGKASSVWKYPQLQIIEPKKINTVLVQFSSEDFNKSNRITFDSAKASSYGISVTGNEYCYIFRASKMNTVTTEQWQDFLRNMTFTTYDSLSFENGKLKGGTEIFWYADEEQWENDMFYNSTNGHFYELVFENLTWDQARQKAKTLYCSPLEVYGYLCNITTADEQAYLQKMLSDRSHENQYWAGGYYDGNYFRWADGPESGEAFWKGTNLGSSIGKYTSWGPGQPDGNSEALQIWSNGSLWTWDDTERGYSKCNAYIVEWGDSTHFGIRPNNHSVSDKDRIGTQVSQNTSKMISVSVNDAQKVYDGNELMPKITVSAEGNDIESPVQYIQATYQCTTESAQYQPKTLPADSKSGSAVIHAGNYTVELSLTQEAKSKGYQLSADSLTSAALKVRKRPLNLSSHDNDRVYDGTSKGEIQNISIEALTQNSGIIKGDSVALSQNSVQGVYLDNSQETIHKGEWTMRRTGTLSLVNNSYEDYYIASENYTGSITARPLFIHSLYLEEPEKARNVKVYDGTDRAEIQDIIIDNVIDGDGVSISKKTLQGVYETSDAGETLKPDGSAQDDAVFKLKEYEITRTESISLSNNPYGDYYIDREEYSGAIRRRTLSVFVGSMTARYGDGLAEKPTAAEEYSAKEGGNGTELEISAMVSGDTLTIDPTKSMFVYQPITKETEAGSYHLEYVGLTEENYPVLKNYIQWYKSGSMIVTPRPLIISAGSHSMIYGDPLPNFEPDYQGFINGDTPETDLQGKAVFTTDATSTSDVGRYPVELSGLKAKPNANGVDNYVVYIQPGTLDINRRPIIIEPDPDPKPDPDPVPELRRVKTEKEADKEAAAVGDVITYKITVTNIGSVELENIPVRDTHDGAGEIEASDGAGYTWDEESKTWTIRRLPVGKSISITYTYQVVQEDEGKDITNVAAATVPGTNPEDPKNPGHGIDPEKPIDPDTEYPSGEVVVPVDPELKPDPDPEPEKGRSISILKFTDTAFASVGDIVGYGVIVKNNGTEDLVNIRLEDVFANAAGEITPVDGEGYVWEDGIAIIPDLPIGKQVTVYFDYMVQEADAGKNLRNVVIASVPGENPPNPEAPDTGLKDPDAPVTPDVEYPSNEVVVPVDPAGGGVAADPKVKIYGDDDPELTYTLTEELIKPDDIWGELERVPGEAVGVYPILQGTLESKNYDITYIPALFYVKPAPLTVKVDDKEREYGEKNPTFTYSVTGFRFNETLEENTNNDVKIHTAAKLESGVGEYAIEAQGLSFPKNDQGNVNYNVIYQPGTLKITPAVLTVTAKDQTKVYGEENPKLTYQVKGFKLKDTLENSTENNAKLRTTATLESGVGEYAIEAEGLSFPKNAQGNVNYKVIYQSGTLKIAPAVLTVTADDQTKVYTDPNPELTYRVKGFKLNDTLQNATDNNVKMDTPVGLYTLVGEYSITPSGLSLPKNNQGNVNYNIKYVPGVFRVLPITGLIEVFAPAGQEVVVRGPDGNILALTEKQFPKTGMSKEPVKIDGGEVEDKIVQYSGLTEKKVPDTYELENGAQTKSLILKDVEYSKAEEKQLTIDYVAFEKPNPPQMYVAVIDGAETTFTLSSLEQTSDYQWRDVDFSTAWYGRQLGDFYLGKIQPDSPAIPFNSENPRYVGYEDTLLNYLGLDTDVYRIVDSEWEQLDEPWENTLRHSGVYHAQKYCASWRAVYTTSSGEYEAKAVYTVPEDDQANTSVTVQYPLKEMTTQQQYFPFQHILIFVCVLLILLIGLILFFWKKHKEKLQNKEKD